MTERMIPAEGSRAPKSLNRLTNGRASGRAMRPAAGVVTGRWNECIGSPDGNRKRRSATRRQRRRADACRGQQDKRRAAVRREAVEGYGSAISGLRLLAIVLASLWLALAVAVLVAYHPGGPYDLLVRAAIFLP